MSRALLAGRMQLESRNVCVFLPTREQLSLAVGVSGWEGGPGGLPLWLAVAALQFC